MMLFMLIYPYHQDSFMDSYNHSSYSNMPPVLRDCCESSYYDVHNCLCRDYLDAKRASLGMN